MRKLDLRSSCKSDKVTCWFYAFERSMLTDKSKEDRLRRWTLKWFFSDFCEQSLVCELILALVSLWLLVNSFKETSKEKRPSDCFILFYSKIFWLFYYLFFKIFSLFYYYFACFWFNRGYSVNDQLDFVLTVIKRDYNTNDRLKFILSFIRRDNGLNDRLKLIKNGRKKKPKVNEIKMKANKTRNELKVSDSKTYQLKNEEWTKNGWRTVKNGGKPSRIC